MGFTSFLEITSLCFHLRDVITQYSYGEGFQTLGKKQVL